MAQCVAHNRTGARARCKSNACTGATVCRMHGGGTPQVRRKAQARHSLKDLMRRDLTDEERRHPWEIMLDAVQRLDDLMRHGDFPDGAAYVEHIERVVRSTKALAESKAAEQLALAYARNVEHEGRLVTDVLVGTLDALLDRLPIAPIDRSAYRTWALGLVWARLAGAPEPELVLPRAIESNVVEVVEPEDDDARDVGASAYDVTPVVVGSARPRSPRTRADLPDAGVDTSSTRSARVGDDALLE